jgi:type IV pilus assembly protein PilY1
MNRGIVFFLLFLLVFGVGTAWADGGGSNCSIPPFVRQGAPPNVLLDISVETPMQGAAHPDITCSGDPASTSYGCSPAACRDTVDGCGHVSNCYDNDVEYYGYFDPDKCYTYAGSGSTGRFEPSSITANHQCSGAWSGNFLNWATMTAIDAVRKAFTGGNRDTLDGSAEAPGETYLLRANQRRSEGDQWVPIKQIDNAGNYTTHSGTVYIINKYKGFAVTTDCSATVRATNGFPDDTDDIDEADELGLYTARVKVCDPSVGLEENCRAYGANYKPVGVMQKYADTMRFGLITYALGPNDSTNSSNRAATNGGVIRANMKWICPTIPRGLKYHDGGTLETCDTPGGCTNPESEINADGTLVTNPDNAPGGNSGVINYLNQFGYQQGYKSHDPISEMYYEAIRYFKALPNPAVPQPTDLYCRFDDGTIIPETDDGFPVYCNRSNLSWRDPMIYRCQQNFIVALNDANPWLDKRLPGTFFTDNTYNADLPETDDFHPSGYVDHGEPTTPDPAINVRTLTNQVGALEGLNGTDWCIGCVPGEAADPNCDVLEASTKTITNLGEIHATCSHAPKRNSYYIAGLAYYAHTNDLRTAAQGNDLEGMQNLTTYVIDTQETSSSMLVGQRNMLYLAAKYGGFVDRNNNGEPDVRTEWDKDSSGDPGYGFPDTYFFASDPSEVETALERTFGEILQRTSSGTAVSVLSTSAEGEGSLFQAFFNPAVYEGSRKISWVGYLNSMWVDQYGNLREDTVQDSNPALVLTEDYVIEFDLSPTGETVVHRYHDADGDGLVDSGDFEDTINLSELTPIYDYGKVLAEGGWEDQEDDRTIYTFKDANKTGRPAPTGEWIDFTIDNAAALQSYLNAADEAEAEFIINYIRGAPLAVTGTDCRNREIDGDIWKLGDIVNSTPSVVGRPMGQYHLIYGDTTYLPFLQRYKDRETIVYVGANDGMLHAFSAGTYHGGDNPSTDPPKVERGWYEGGDKGTEKWAYVPYNLLPHLKWLTDQDYCHVYYVDLKTRVVDARIFDPPLGDTDHPKGWGTVLIGAMRFGGPAIVGGPISDQRTFCSAYFAFDITNPESDPKLLWEFTDPTPGFNLGYTVSYPTTIRRGPEDEAGTWYAIFGSGPSTFDGSGATTGHVYVRNLLTGFLEKQFDITIDSKPLFMATPISIDKELDYDVDVAYIGATYDDSGTWRGKMFRIDFDHDNNFDWSLSTFFSSDRPITSAPTAALDPYNRLWLFWGTGRYFSDADKTDSTDQRIYGVWDPYPGAVVSLIESDLTRVTDIRVHEDGYVDFNGDGAYSGDDKPFEQYLADVRGDYHTAAKYGWYLEMPATGERSLAKSTLLGDIVLFPTFDPNDDLCDYGGDSYLYALYYETGTAYKESVIGLGTNTLNVGGLKQEILKKKELGQGMPTPVVIHAGQQQGVKGLIQLGTGVVAEIDIDPAALPQSKVLFWREKTD